MNFMTMRVSQRMKLLLALIAASGQALAAEAPRHTSSVLCVRTSDEIAFHAGQSYLAFTEVIVAGTIMLDSNREPGARYLAQFFFSPVLINDGTIQRLAFPTLKPQVTVSNGKILRCRFYNGDGKDAVTAAGMNEGGCYIVDVEFDGEVPKKFVLTMQLASPEQVKPDSTLKVHTSDDGFPGTLKYPEPSHFLIRVNSEPALGLPRLESNGSFVQLADGAWKEVEKGMDYVVHFGGKPMEGVSPEVK